MTYLRSATGPEHSVNRVKPEPARLVRRLEIVTDPASAAAIVREWHSVGCPVWGE